MTNFEKYISNLTQDKLIDSMILNCDGCQYIPVTMNIIQRTMV